MSAQSSAPTYEKSSEGDASPHGRDADDAAGHSAGDLGRHIASVDPCRLDECAVRDNAADDVVGATRRVEGPAFHRHRPDDELAAIGKCAFIEFDAMAADHQDRTDPPRFQLQSKLVLRVDPQGEGGLTVDVEARPNRAVQAILTPADEPVDTVGSRQRPSRFVRP